jgi:hypothetical protein
MPTVAQNLEIWGEDSIALDITIHQDDGVTPLNLHSTTANWAVSSIYDHSVALIRKTSATIGEINITNEAQGLLTIFLTPADTDGLGGQLYYHEMEIVDGAGASVTVLTGTMAINKTIPSV